MEKREIILFLIVLVFIFNIGTTLAGIDESSMPPHGGSPENTVVIINPTLNISKYIANYYISVRKIPEKNIIYMDPYATSYDNFNSTNIRALTGMLDNNNISDHIDYIIISSIPPNTSQGGISSQSYVTSGCVQAHTMSISTAYSTMLIKSVIFAVVDATKTNDYDSQDSYDPIAFDNSFNWSNGNKSTAGERYFISSLLGYTGPYGNTPSEIIAMINRSVLVDGTMPNGTFYFVKTTDVDRSGPRDEYYYDLANLIKSDGGNAENLTGVGNLPSGRQDALGIMTGAASPGVVSANITIKPGAYGDSLTSYAGVLTRAGGQEVMTSWISKGASGTSGTVEEPCNYPGKFSHVKFHYFYYKGLSLGESYLRSIGYVPFQNLLLGDPLTRPFAYIPVVNVSIPAGSVSGNISINVSSYSPNASLEIYFHNLFVDGILKETVLNGNNFSLDTYSLTDGYHNVHVISYDNSSVATPGRWTGEIYVNNSGNSLTLSVSPESGDLSTIFNFTVSSSSNISQIRLIQNNRIIAADSGQNSSFRIHANTLGAGPVKVIAESESSTGFRIISLPVYININYSNSSNTSVTLAPVAFNYTADIITHSPYILNLPASDANGVNLNYSIISGPAQSTIGMSVTNLSLRLLSPFSNASNNDTIVYNVSNTIGSSLGTITIRYNYSAPSFYPPTSILSSPSANSESGLGLVTFTCNATDRASLTNITFYLWNSSKDTIIINSTNITSSSNSSSFSYSFSSYGAYTWNCLAVNTNNYSKWDVNRTINLVSSNNNEEGSSGSSGGGSGGGGGAVTEVFWKNTIEILSRDNTVSTSRGLSRDLGEKERIKVSIDNEEHYVGIVKIAESNKTATLEIMSSPINVTLNIGEERLLDINLDSYPDLYLKLNSIINKKVSFTLKQLEKKAPEEKIINESKNTTEVPYSPKEPSRIWNFLPEIIIFGVISLLIIIAFILYIRGKRLAGMIDSSNKRF